MLERTRARRPWVISVFAVLAAGLLGSGFLYRNAVASRNISESRRASLEQMYAFVARDLLGQSNPYLNVPGANIPGQTLLEAIRTALPNIDRRFARQPEIAARLHVTIADAFRTRAQFAEADAQYAAAGLKFHEAGQERSAEAIEAELKRDDALMVSVAPGAFAKAQESFARQNPSIAKLPRSQVEGPCVGGTGEREPHRSGTQAGRRFAHSAGCHPAGRGHARTGSSGSPSL